MFHSHIFELYYLLFSKLFPLWLFFFWRVIPLWLEWLFNFITHFIYHEFKTECFNFICSLWFLLGLKTWSLVNYLRLFLPLCNFTENAFYYRHSLTPPTSQNLSLLNAFPFRTLWSWDVICKSICWCCWWSPSW